MTTLPPPRYRIPTRTVLHRLLILLLIVPLVRRLRSITLRMIVSPIAYACFALGGAIQLWINETSKEKFDAIVANPQAHLHELLSLAVALSMIAFGILKSWANRDLGSKR